MGAWIPTASPIEPALELACPHDGASLETTAEALVCAGGHRFPLQAWAGNTFADFSGEADLDVTAAWQRATYDDGQANKYAQQGQGDKARFMRQLVERRISGHTKSKERLLLSTFQGLGLGAAPRLLEVGCNDGRYLYIASALSGGSGLGIDISAAAIRQALEAQPPGDANRFHVGRADRLPLPSACVDCVLSFDVFEHLGQRGFECAMGEVARVLKPGGALLVYIVSQKDRFTLHETLRQVSGGRIGVDDGEGHRWENFIHPDRFRAVATGLGLEVTRLRAYHGFWTLFAEYYFYNAPPAWAFRLLDLLDYPLIRFEHGNGFLAVARKNMRQGGMNRQRLKAVARELLQPRILLRLAKTGAVLTAEIASAPLWSLAARCVREGPAAERLLGIQNRFRRAAMWWIFPEFRPEFPPQLRPPPSDPR